MLFAVLLPAVGLGLPYAIAVFPVHALRCAVLTATASQGQQCSCHAAGAPSV